MISIKHDQSYFLCKLIKFTTVLEYHIIKKYLVIIFICSHLQ